MTSDPTGPLLTLQVQQAMRLAAHRGLRSLQCSLDLDRTRTTVELQSEAFTWQGSRYPFLPSCKDRTIYYWATERFQALARYGGALIKLVPTPWGAPTFEIDGIKMLPTARVSPYADAQRKVELVQPCGKVILDTCGGLGYFAAWCLQGQAMRVLSYEKNADVLWLRSLNPWSPGFHDALTLIHADIAAAIVHLPDHSVDAILHDPPRFALAGELYAQSFYEHLWRVLRARGPLFHYTGTPNKLTSGRDVPNEVAARLRRVGFSTRFMGDGVLATRGRAASGK